MPIHRVEEAYWRDLEANAHLPQVRELIKEEIMRGAIRVRPNTTGGLCIVPIARPGAPQPDGTPGRGT